METGLDEEKGKEEGGGGREAENDSIPFYLAHNSSQLTSHPSPLSPHTSFTCDFVNCPPAVASSSRCPLSGSRLPSEQLSCHRWCPPHAVWWQVIGGGAGRSPDRDHWDWNLHLSVCVCVCVCCVCVCVCVYKCCIYMMDHRQLHPKKAIFYWKKK